MDTSAPGPLTTEEALAKMSRRADAVAKSFNRLHKTLEKLLGVLRKTNQQPPHAEIHAMQQAIVGIRDDPPSRLYAFAEAESSVHHRLDVNNQINERWIRDLCPFTNMQRYYPQPSRPAFFPRVRAESHGDVALSPLRQHHIPIYEDQPIDALQRGMRSRSDSVRAHDGVQRREKKRSRESMEESSQEVEPTELGEADSAPATFKKPRLPGVATSIEHGEANDQ